MKMSEYAQKEIEFLGRITAGSTHEMKNVLAIIKESSGLMEDLITLSPETPTPLREKFQKTLSVIQNQVHRGSEISDRLNRFAHSTDAPVDDIDLQTAAEQIVSLAQRFARLNRVDLTIDPSTATMTRSVRPVRLLATLFGCIECCLAAIPPASRIHVGTRHDDDGPAVYVEWKGDFTSLPDPARSMSADSRWPGIEGMAATLGARLELDGAGRSARLCFPKTPA
jgi:signal transduction histidine kinase